MDAISKFCGGDATAGFVQAGHKPGIAERKGIGQIVIGTVRHAQSLRRTVQTGLCAEV